MLHTSALKVAAVVETYLNWRGERRLLSQPVGCGWEQKALLSGWEKMKYQGLTAERGRKSPVLDKQDYWSRRLSLDGFPTAFGVRIFFSKKPRRFFAWEEACKRLQHESNTTLLGAGSVLEGKHFFSV